MRVANRFTPEVLLSAPRRSAATPNSTGTLALYTVSAYSFQSHSKAAEIRVLDINNGQSRLLSNDLNASEPVWLGDGNLVLWIQGGEKGVSSLMLADADKPDIKPHTVAAFDGPVSNLKTHALEKDTIGIALTGQITPSGKLYNPESAEKPLSTAKVYTSLFVRHWDAYVTENKSTIWFAALEKSSGGTYHIASPGLVDGLSGFKDSGFSSKLESPVPPFGGASDFDISKSGLVFIAKDLKLNAATHTKTDLYFVPLKSFRECQPPSPQLVKTGNLRGYCGSPVFSPNAKSVAFTRMKSEFYESDKPRLLLLADIGDLNNVQEFFETDDGKGGWDVKPGSILWSQDGSELYLTADEKGREKLWKVPSSPRHAKDLPTPLTETGSVSSVKWLAHGDSRLFVSSTSLVDNSMYIVVDPLRPLHIHTISSNSKYGKAFGLSQDQVDEIWYEGGGEYKVHAFVVKPSTFDKTKKYPLAYLIHGGPQSAWNEGWSTRWNPAIFAEQGYVVVAPNPTGSSGYGMNFQDAIKNDWGGRPYQDLVKGFEYIEKNISYIDTDRAVALGASYGGYMINFIQGNDLGRKFKALVCHDGVFSTMSQYASEELFFPNHDFGGSPWENREGYMKWDPAKYLGNWATPQLVIHNELDYRLPIAEGLAAFNVLQSKSIPSKLLVFTDENHVSCPLNSLAGVAHIDNEQWVLKPENSLIWHKEVIEWMNKYSGIDGGAT